MSALGIHPRPLAPLADDRFLVVERILYPAAAAAVKAEADHLCSR